MFQSDAVGTFNQTHTGSGDNVKNKFLIQLQALAPSDLSEPIAMVLSSIREKKVEEAKLLLKMLRSTSINNREVATLLDVIAIYGELVEPEHTQNAFDSVVKIAASSSNEVVKDLCIAALLKFSRSTKYEQAATAEYLGTAEPGPYSREAYYRDFAPHEVLIGASNKLILSEGELTGLVEGALRLAILDLASALAARLHELHPSYNSRVLLLSASAHILDPKVKERQYWLTSPDVRAELDELVEELSALIELSEGSDARLYNMAGPILHYFQVISPVRLVNACAKYHEYLTLSFPEMARRVRTIAGDETAYTEEVKAVSSALKTNESRSSWCRARLENDVDLQEALQFTRLAKPEELRRWLSLEKEISDATDIDFAIVTLLAWSRVVCDSGDSFERYQLGQKVDEFVSQFEARLAELSVHVVVELAQLLFNAQLPHKGLEITSRLMPQGDLWPSPFVLLQLRSLLETEQYQSFDELIARIPDATDVSLLYYRSQKEEALGDSDAALALSDQMIEQEPNQLFCWLRGCKLREQISSVDEQRRFLSELPDHLLDNFSHNTMLAMRYLTSVGNFKRAEPRLVKWFVEDPSARAAALVDFHLGFAFRHQANFIDSHSLPGYIDGVSFEQDGKPQTRLVVEDGQAKGQHVLVKGSQLALLLDSLEKGESATLNLVTYTLIERLPPYVACLRLAAQLRHSQNDGSDNFAMFTVPDDPAEIGAFFEQKFGPSRTQAKLSEMEGMPLYLQGHALHSSDPIKAAMRVWSDSSIAKTWLVNDGVNTPTEIVLDAYSIAYLALSNLVDAVLNAGYTFVLPAETRNILAEWVAHITHEDFLSMGFGANGRLIPHTAEDVRTSEGHTIRGLQRILEDGVIKHPGVHNTDIELYAIRDVIDHTVYLAMQLSSASALPWFCMDRVFAKLHHSNGFMIANVHEIVAQGLSVERFVFEDKRHGLLLFSQGAIPRPFMHAELDGLARNSNPMSSVILGNVFQKYGRLIFPTPEGYSLLLRTLITHLVCKYYRHDLDLLPFYTPWVAYDEHAFNHGLRLYVTGRGKHTAEFWLAVALKNALSAVPDDSEYALHVVALFENFVKGHFYSEHAMMVNYLKFDPPAVID